MSDSIIGAYENYALFFKRIGKTLVMNGSVQTLKSSACDHKMWLMQLLEKKKMPKTDHENFLTILT